MKNIKKIFSLIFVLTFLLLNFSCAVPVFAAKLSFKEQLLSFPEDYRASLEELHKVYPNWYFKADKLSVSYNSAVNEEYSVPFRKEVQAIAGEESLRSMQDTVYDWNSGVWKTDNGGWTSASKETVAYYMDPRNFLNANDIFMFFMQSYDENQTAADLRPIVAGTFLEKGYGGNKDAYISDILAAAKSSGVNAAVLASTIIQEQGTSGTSDLISGKYKGYENLYNFFNVGATDPSSDHKKVVVNGLKYAKSKGWTTRRKAIVGGATFYSDGYISKGQDTYFYKDYNLPNKVYWHQYASAVQDALSSGRILKKTYINNKTAALTFKIPVYTSIPKAVAKAPVKNSKRNNYYITSLSASGISPAFSMFNQSYKLTVKGDTVIYLKTPNSASVSSALSYALTKGENTVKITVKAETGNTNTYTIKVTAEKDCTLKISASKSKIYSIFSGNLNSNIKWTFNSENGELTLIGSGKLPDYSSASSVPFNGYKNEIKTLTVDDGITNIGKYAFSGFSALLAVNLPDSVTQIGDYAFSNCKNLYDVTLSEKVTTIGDKAFDQSPNIIIHSNPEAYPITYAKGKGITYSKYLDSQTIRKYNNVYYYVANGIIDYNATLIMEYNGKLRYINQGLYDTSSDTLCEYQGALHHVKGGFMVNDSGVLVKYSGKWYYVTDGVPDYTANLLCDHSDKKLYIKDGIWTRTTEVVKLDDVYYYINNGIYDTSTQTVAECKADEKWYHIKGGTLAGKTNLILNCNNTTWYYIRNGVWQKDANLLYKYKDVYRYVRNGLWQKNANVVYKYNNSYFYIKNGNWKNEAFGFFLYKGAYRYIRNGKWRNTSTGFVEYKGYLRYVKNGNWKNTYTGFLKHKGYYRYIKNGIYKNNVTGLVKYNGKHYLVKKGIWKNTYTGIYKYNGKSYYVKKGIMNSSVNGWVKCSGKYYYLKNSVVK